MHIGFRTSGGRGEYELVGGHAGQTAAALEGWTFHFRWPDGVVRDTQLWLDPGESGKPRLRSLAIPRFQIGRQVAAVLLLPPPIRELRHASSTLPVIQANNYVITKIGFGPDTEFASPPETVSAEPNYIEVTNAVDTDYVNVSSRWARIDRIWSSQGNLPDTVASAVNLHQRFLASGIPVNEQLSRIGHQLRKALLEVDGTYDGAHDPLPYLERLAMIPSLDGPSLPPPDELGEDEIDIKLRSAQIYRIVKARGFSARNFSLEVRKAYGHRCAFCGVLLDGLEGVQSGIDAAHILAWGAYDLDVIDNGIALCKNHHWAFDVALMVPVFVDGSLVIRFTDRQQLFDSTTLRILGEDRFVIPDEWLPNDIKMRPNPKYLLRLYDDLAVIF